VQVSRVDLEARRIEFRLVQGTSFDALRKAAARGPDEPSRRVKKAAAPKPAALKGQTAKERRAEAKKAGKAPKASQASKRAAPAKKAVRKRH
jgi:ribonuclease R